MTTIADVFESDVLVIGGGLAGLAAATLAARRGLGVTLVEGRNHPGGRATTAHKDGYLLNQGPHALYLGGPAEAVLGGLGVDTEGAPPASVNGGIGVLAGESGALPVSLTSLARTRLLGVRAKAEVGRLFVTLGRLDASRFDHTSVAEWIRSCVGQPESRAFLGAMVRVSSYSNTPELTSAGAAIRQLQLAAGSGVRYLDGGWSQLVDGLVGVAEAAGVALWRGEGVRTLARDEASYNATVADGRAVRAAAVIVAAGGPKVSQELLGGLGLDLDLVGAAGPAVEAASLDLGLRTSPRDAFALGLDTPLYASQHSPAARLAPPGAALVTAMRYLTPGEQHDPSGTEAELRAHAARLGVADADVVLDRYLHRMTVAGGTPLASRGGLSGRPPVAVPGADGVLLAGDWVGREAMLADASLASAREAARLAELRVRAVGTRDPAHRPGATLWA